MASCGLRRLRSNCVVQACADWGENSLDHCQAASNNVVIWPGLYNLAEYGVGIAA